LRVGSASAPYSIELNGEIVAKIGDSASAHEIDITRKAQEGSNTIKIIFDVIDRSRIIEGWRQAEAKPHINDVYVVSQPTQMIRDIFTDSRVVGENLVTKLGIIVKSHALNQRTSNISVSLQSEAGEVLAQTTQAVTQRLRGEDTLYLNAITPLRDAWQADRPTMQILKLSTQHEGRYQEHQTYNVALRSVELNESGELFINGQKVELKAKRITTEYNPMELYKLKDMGYNSVVISAGVFNRELISECDREGIYVLLTAPINTSNSGSGIEQGGNISNNPLLRSAFIDKIQTLYYTTQLHPSIIAYIIAENSTNGCNLYDSYLEMKRLSTNRPVLYLDADGEWNSDIISIKID
ncbi:MAG: glycoside hydrolase family 2 TIM barrel-domain containing protein, partial [Rikenellaceae bacterium]